MYKVKNEQGEWVEVGKPEDGQQYRLYHANGGLLESTWSDPVVLPKVVVTNPATSRVLAAVNSDVSLSIEIQDNEGNVQPVNDSFAVPIRRVGGAVERTIGVNFTDGVANKTINWPTSGEFEITEDLINMHLPSGQQFEFNKLSISVYE